MYNNNHLAACLAQHVQNTPEKIFAHRAGLPDVSYARLFQTAERIANFLRSEGVSAGERVAAQVDKSLETIELYLGTVLAGGVFLPLNPAYTVTELDYFLSDATPIVVVCDPARAQEISPISGDARVLTLSSDGTGTLFDLLDSVDPDFIATPRSKDDLAAILYTSGTTGRSKGAMLSHENLASNSLTLCDAWEFTASDVLIHALPIFHTHGLFVATNVALFSGASLIFLPEFDQDAIIKALPEATTLMGVPTFYTRLLNDARLVPDLVKSMRLFISGSAPLLVDTHIEWERRTGHVILERYGMTETNMNTSNPYVGARRAGTVGPPLPGIEVRVMDGDIPVKGGDIGGLEVRGPNVFQGYWKMPEKTAEELRPDGWFITGDLGIIDDQGYVSIVGRSKDLIISGGFNVYPKEIETLLDDIPGVLESAVIGVPHPDFGEAVIAIIVAASENLSLPDIQSSLTKNVARYKQPKKIIALQELPRNTMGKVQKKALRERYQSLFGH